MIKDLNDIYTCQNLLTAILAFEPVQRYHGMLPKHVAATYHPDKILAAENLGLICWDVIIDEHEREIKGLRLTANGRKKIEDATESDKT